MKRWISAITLAFIFPCFLNAYAQDVSRLLNVKADGSAEIIKNDVAAAREEAIRNALQRAVLEAAAALLLLSVDDEKFLPVKKSEILENSDKYVSNYKIAAESNNVDAYKITINVLIVLRDLKKDLAKAGLLKISTENIKNTIVYLDFKGAKKYSDFSSLKELLKTRTKIVKNVFPRVFAAQTVLLEIEILETPQALAEELAKTGLYVLNTERIDQNEIEIRLLQRENTDAGI